MGFFKSIKRAVKGVTKGVGSLIGSFLGTSNKRYSKGAKILTRFAEEDLKLRKELWKARKEKLPEMERFVKRRFAESRKDVASAMGTAFEQLGLTRSSHLRMLNRVGAMTGMSSGALAGALRASSEELGSSALNIQTEFSRALANLGIQEADVVSKLTPLYLNAGDIGLGAGAGYGGAFGSLLSQRPPSLFDRLLDVGSLILK